MSFRELRNFTEMMKTLGYRRLISVENFRMPNFELVADVLYWMVHRYDPTATISDDISTEDLRINFLKAVSILFYNKAQIKLNIKSLYQADGYAVKELLKVAGLLYKAFLNSTGHRGREAEEEEEPVHGEKFKDSKNLGSEIVDTGAKLHNLLGKEKVLRLERDGVVKFLDELAFNLESNDSHKMIEQAIQSKTNQLTDDIATLQTNNKRLESDAKSFAKKIQRKANELERAEKRLRSLQRVRPEFMKEYEGLERELVQVYNVYIEKFRNLSYLESELDKHRTIDLEKKREEKRQLKRVQKRLREEELKILRGEDVDDEAFDTLFTGSGRSSGSSSCLSSPLARGSKGNQRRVHKDHRGLGDQEKERPSNPGPSSVPRRPSAPVHDYGRSKSVDDDSSSCVSDVSTGSGSDITCTESGSLLDDDDISNDSAPQNNDDDDWF